MSADREEKIRVTSLGITFVVAAALVVIGLSTTPHQSAAIRYALAAIAFLSAGTWITLQEKQRKNAAGEPFVWWYAVAKVAILAAASVVIVYFVLRWLTV